MSKHSNREPKKCTVRSKYFTAEPVMDESLSDFEEPVKRPTGPKKTTVTKIKSKKNQRKRIRGQKDIRTALKGKQELEAYSKDFDKVCKNAGIDVDSEELQLAIAVSKSLQDCPSTSTEATQSSRAENSQERIGRIKTTLQEYGFKVPEIKITTATRRQRRHKKNYKLIFTSDAQKQEIIANRYSEVLLRNLTHLNSNSQILKQCSNSNNIFHSQIYYLATSAHYDTLKNQDTFYVDNLIEKSMSSGNLLRDWSQIPGRAVSPTHFEPSNMNFSEIVCSQEEIDIVLSGPLKSCKNVIGRKNKELLVNNDSFNIACDDNIKDKLYNNDHEDTVNNKTEQEMLKIETKQSRSVSPDLFDDDDCSKLVDSDNVIQINCNSSKSDTIIKEVIDQPVCENNYKPQVVYEDPPNSFSKYDTTKRKSNDYMEITDCIEVESKYSTNYPESHKNNTTKRCSNDFMEMTECIHTSSHGLSVHDKIDLTQMPPISEEEIDVEAINVTAKNIPDDPINKSTGTFNDQETCTIQINIDLTDIPDNHNNVLACSNEQRKKNTVADDNNVDLTQSSEDSDGIPFVSFSKKKDKSVDENVIIDLNDYPGLNKKSSLHTEEVHIDLTQHDEITTEINKPSQSLLEDYIYYHSDNNEEQSSNNADHDQITQSNTPNIHSSFTENDHCENRQQHLVSVTKSTDNINLTLSPIQKLSNNVDEDNVDLTQKSDSSKNLSPCSSQINSILRSSSKEFEHDSNISSIEYQGSTSKNSQSYSSLGKKGDVSIDYDELNNTRPEIGDTSENKSPIYEIPEENTEETSQSNIRSNCSQNSEVFEISDKEFDYSMHRSKLEKPLDNFALGGLSIFDELSSLKSFKKSTEPDILSDNIRVLKENVEINQQKEISPIKHRRITEIATSQEACSSNMIHTVTTPQNSKFIIKTNNVTPMLDYESMSTPELHKELDNYGIKPFKRKRAIQLLTHIYDQTHPIVESCDEASPPKKRKPNDASPRKRITPRKLLESPRKASETNENEATEEASCLRNLGISQGARNVREIDNETQITGNEVPISTDVECKPEDWVFQKREKAKVHTCRVPLHIAFYNYVRSHSELRQAILCYEPVNIDNIHKELASHGHRYDPKDLLKFMDKKCITVKTTDNDARNYKR